jgi:UDP-3-O-[3-hydroxymyristoyl] glucosamine N-acyltransferase
VNAKATKSVSSAAKVISLREIAAHLGCAAPASDAAITGVATLEDAGPDDLSLVGSDAFIKQFEKTRAGAVLVQQKVKVPAAPNGTVVLTVADADLAMTRVLEMFAQPHTRPAAGIDKQSRVDPSAKLDKDVAIGAFAMVGPGCRIGRGTIIHPYAYIGQDVQIGQDCEIFPHVTIRDRITIGNRVVIHAGAAIGTDGFGYRWDGSKHAKVPQIGTVIIEDDVEIGSCACIDRAKFSATRIGTGTKIDNLVQIAHNVVIGPHCILAGQVGLAGSITLGKGVTLGGQAGLKDHITIGDGATVSACGAVLGDIEPGILVSGVPALPHRQSLREQAALRRLPDMVVQVRNLQAEIDRLKEELAKRSAS